MKKALSKPISSPNRADNFPPPLMRFLRSNVGSKSRGKSKSQRSTSIFYTRGKRNSAKVIETTQEPSSPKVTCIGQVRAAKSTARKRGGASVKIRRRCWFGGNLFRSRKLAIRGFFRRCGLFFRYCYCKRVDKTEGSIRVYSEKNENTENGDGAREIKNIFDVNSFSPPKNALILTRCRSAPYKSSSLGGLFWGSSFPENDAKSDQLEKHSCDNSKELENLGKNVEDLKGIGGGAVHPLVLTRCKSEPARTGERPNPEGNLWRRRRLGDV